MAGLLDGIASSEKLSSVFSGTNVYASTGSFTNVTLGGSVTAGRLGDSNGPIFSASVGAAGAGSPGTYGTIVQGGVAGPLLAATGSIIFGRAFSNSSFVVTITPQVSGTLFPYIVSGTTTYTVSGVTFGAQSGLAYNWMAIGL